MNQTNYATPHLQMIWNNITLNSRTRILDPRQNAIYGPQLCKNFMAIVFNLELGYFYFTPLDL